MPTSPGYEAVDLSSETEVVMNRGKPLAILLALFFVLLTGAPALAEPAATVMRLQGMVEAQGPAGPRALRVGDPVDEGERVTTGPEARLALSFADGMDLTLGERADLTIERFTWAADGPKGEASLSVASGVFLVRSGAVAALPDHPLALHTPLASIGVRGTRYWGGPLDTPFDILLLDGEITVTSPGGSVTLTRPGDGTSVRSPGAPPDPPAQWKGARMDRALSTIDFAR
jgi:hypothetical protein